MNYIQWLLGVSIPFPNLTSVNSRPTSPVNDQYNCIAWAASDADQWWWPDPLNLRYWPPGIPRVVTISAFETAYGLLGYSERSNPNLDPALDKVAIFADVSGIPTHAARQLPDGWWASKLGENIDIEHELSAIEGPGYGRVSVVLARPAPVDPNMPTCHMPHPQFDRSRLIVKPLAERVHDLTLECLLPLDSPADFDHPSIPILAERLKAAKDAGAARILMMGGHVLRAGTQRHLIDLMERGLISLIAMNGAGPIHDWEFALIGASTESVAKYVRTGEFGLWHETGAMNDAINVRDGLGLGEAIGKAIHEGHFPHKEISVLAAAYRLGVPVTVHIGIGYDILHEHPNADGAALGAASYTDFLIFAEHVRNLEKGVVLSFGTAVMGPEIYLKALAMARNVAHQEGKRIADFTTAVFDLIPLGDDYHTQAPKTDPRYYYRPWKTILVRTVADGGESFYVAGDHRQTLPALWRAAVD